jgi:preprotein translocase subunit Sss1
MIDTIIEKELESARAYAAVYSLAKDPRASEYSRVADVLERIRNASRTWEKEKAR